MIERGWRWLWLLGGVLLMIRSIPQVLAISNLNYTPHELLFQLWGSMPHVWKWDTMSWADWAWTADIRVSQPPSHSLASPGQCGRPYDLTAGVGVVVVIRW